MAMNGYPQDGGDIERGAWALCTGIDAALFVFGLIAFLIVGAQLIFDISKHRRRK